MIVEKVLNNNVVVSIDPTTRKEVILMGNGIAFNKKPGQLIDVKRIEKTFIVDDENLGNKIKKLINQIPEGIFELTDEIITHAIVELNVELDKQGRINISPVLINYAHLIKDCVIIGTGDRIEIWSSDNWESFFNSTKDIMSDIAENLFNESVNL